jgi:hypothetical protein
MVDGEFLPSRHRLDGRGVPRCGYVSKRFDWGSLAEQTPMVGQWFRCGPGSIRARTVVLTAGRLSYAQQPRRPEPGSERMLKAVRFDQFGGPEVLETATRALDQLGVGSGSTLLINGASGSVGSAAVQLAVVRDARVIGTASPANHSYLRSLGAEPVAYGEGLAGCVRALVPDGVDAALDVAGSGVLPELIGLAGAGVVVPRLPPHPRPCGSIGRCWHGRPGCRGGCISGDSSSSFLLRPSRRPARGTSMNSWVIWVVWGAFAFVAALLCFVLCHIRPRPHMPRIGPCRRHHLLLPCCLLPPASAQTMDVPIGCPECQPDPNPIRLRLTDDLGSSSGPARRALRQGRPLRTRERCSRRGSGRTRNSGGLGRIARSCHRFPPTAPQCQPRRRPPPSPGSG